MCKPGYFPANNKCEKVDANLEIANCELYKSKEKCSTCVTGFVASMNRTSCVEIENDNCLTFTYLECSDCIDNYEINKLTFFTDLFQNDANLLRWIISLSFSLE